MDSKCYYRFHAVLLSNNGHAFGCKNCFFRNPAGGKRTPPPYLESQHERYSIHVEKNELHRSYRQLGGNVVECVSDVYGRSIIFRKKTGGATKCGAPPCFCSITRPTSRSISFPDLRRIPPISGWSRSKCRRTVLRILGKRMRFPEP